MYVMSTFYCIQKHDDVLKYGRKKYTIVYYTHKSKYVKKIYLHYFKSQFRIADSGPRFRIQYVKL